MKPLHSYSRIRMWCCCQPRRRYERRADQAVLLTVDRPCNDKMTNDGRALISGSALEVLILAEREAADVGEDFSRLRCSIHIRIFVYSDMIFVADEGASPPIEVRHASGSRALSFNW